MLLGRTIALCCLLAAAIQAQVTFSTIRGSVADPSGAAVANVNITLTNLGTNVARSVVSNENGDYEIPDVPRGSYKLTAVSPGFKTFVAENIILESNQTRRINVPLELGAVGSEVMVRADAAVISTDSAKIQASFTSQRFEDAPWVGDGRNPQTVMTTLPLVQSTSGIYGVQIAGQPSSQVQTAIDGVSGDGSSLQASNVHVMQEVQVVMGNNSAEYSRAASVVMNTKAGTNDFHGRAPAGRFGNSGLNVLEGPGLHMHDITLGKSFPITERLKFTFLAAAQNAFNHANFNNPGSNLSAPGTYGVITSVRGFAPARQIMLRGRVEF